MTFLLVGLSMLVRIATHPCMPPPSAHRIPQPKPDTIKPPVKSIANARKPWIILEGIESSTSSGRSVTISMVMQAVAFKVALELMFVSLAKVTILSLPAL
jgi:hypothetical protein